ncbi:alpha-2Db adrenergic receptor-like [Haliotis rufescens]|uniref:alpha-2Db adrenergic receptor-like n=1 Tax=Haliotis rufescens TaxID=6454 RepID=UPI001EAFD60B|nr:alpha-2Db adrenergic receptor-like [Haliotis rufescens]XP_046342702.1 alpha-2Db adrenergic receptor-like [Haliotis rufescens]
MNLTTIDASDLTETERSRVEIGLLSVLIFLIILIAITGNTAVIFAIYTSHRLKEEISNMFIVNLSITDLTSAVVVLGSALVAMSTDRWPMGQAWCDIVCYVNYCMIIVSMLNLCFISVDRYIAIVHSLHYNLLMTRRKVFLMIAYSWFQGSMFGCVPVIFRWVKYDYWEAICAIQWHKQREKALYYVIIAFIMCFLVPGLILIICYCQILKTIKTKQQAITRVSDSPRVRVKYSTSSKAMYGLLVVVVAYFVCMTPFSVTKLYKVAADEDNVLPGYVNLTASLTGYLSSAVNPLIYGIFRKDFRKAFKLVLKKILAERAVAPANQDIDLMEST